MEGLSIRKLLAESILSIIVIGLTGNAWAVWNDLQALKVREPITLEDVKELKKEIRELKQLLIEVKYKERN
jgi:hypothetical protein